MNILKPLIYFFFLCLLSCQNRKETETIHITIEQEKTTQLPLSEITEDIQAIELEVTDESMIGVWQQGYRGYPLDKYIMFFERSRTKNQILLFNKKGRFIRSIGRKGHGRVSLAHF